MASAKQSMDVVFSMVSPRLVVKGGKGGTVPVSDFSITFAVNGIPQCVAVLPYGTDLSTNREETLKGFSLLDAESEVIKASLIITDRVSRRDYELFYGTILNTSVVTATNATGGSQLMISITLQHQMADLRSINFNSFVYATGNILGSMTTDIEQLRKDNRYDTAMKPGSVIAEQVYEACKKEGYNVVSGIKALANIINECNQHTRSTMFASGPVKADIDVGDYITGNVRLQSTVNKEKYMYAIMNAISDGTKQTDLLSCLVSIIANPDYSLIASPNNLRKFEIMPNNAWIGKAVYNIDADSIMVANDSQDLTRKVFGADVIAVTDSGSPNYNPGSSSTPASYISAYYPASIPNGLTKYKVETVACPKWVNAWYRTGTYSEQSTDTSATSGSGLKKRLEAYAKMMYAVKLYSGHAIVLQLAPDQLDIYKYLGKLISYSTKNVATIPSSVRTVMYGVLSSVQMRYSGRGSSSSFEITVTLGQCRNEKTQKKLAMSENPIYAG